MKRFAILFTLVLLCAAQALVAQERTRPFPRLVIQDPETKQYRPLGIHDLGIKVRVVGNLAVTSMDITFYNDNGRVLEGEFVFPLPAGCRVSGFSLEVNGRLREGVVVGKHQGRQVFEKIVRDMIDPGLLEWTQGNNFRARVYPVPAKGYKRMVIEWTQELPWREKGFLYKLPLAFPEVVANVVIEAEVFKQQAWPELGIGENGIKDFFFKKWQENYNARIMKKNWKPDRTLAFLLPRTQAYSSLLVEKDKAAGDDAFYLHLLPEVKATPQEKPKRVLLVWDASASMALRRRTLELQVLDAFFAANPQAEIKVLLLRNDVTELKSGYGQWKELRAALADVPLDGATSFGRLDLTGQGADMVLLSTDGLDTFGSGTAKLGNAPIYSLVSSEQSDYDFLRYLAASTGGVLVDLNTTGSKDALRLLSRKVFSLLKTEVVSGSVSGLSPAGITPVIRDLSLTGSLASDKAELKLSFGIQGQVYYTRTVLLERKYADTGNLVPRIRAQKQIDELMPFWKDKHAAIHKLAEQYTIVTRETSLLVLDRVEDYVKYKILPPDELKDAYMQALTQADDKRKQTEKSHLDELVAQFKVLGIWWEKDFPLDTPRIIDHPKKMRMDRDAAPRDTRAPGMMQERSRSMNGGSGGRPSPGHSNREETTKKVGNSGGGSGDIVLKPWDPKAPYLKELEGLAVDAAYARYLAIRKAHGNSSAFYLDVADYFFNRKEKALALRVISNIAEMRLENPQLLRVLAHRLDQLEFHDLSLDTFFRVQAMRPEDPQSFRDPALVLEKMGRYDEAVALLYKVAVTPWDGRFPEIGLIALNEMNGILGRFPAVKRDGLDPRLVRHMPVDLRVILTWDADNCDMDLWVTDPNREKCYYGHRLTYQGGRMSRDFTQGYGPEEYMVRRAKDGTYQVEVNYYGNSQQIIAGATTVQLKLFLNYGRPDQTVREVTLRLKDKQEVVQVGEFRIRFGHK